MLDEGRFLPEVARLMFVWRLHGMEPAAEEVLCHWARTTAAWTRTAPVPRHGILALRHLGLLATNSAGECLPSHDLLDSLTEDSEQPEDMPDSLGLCIFERMFGDDRFRDQLERVLQFCRIQENAITAQWCHVPSVERRNIGWIWLQQLGLGQHDGAVVQISQHLEPYLLEAGVGPAPLSQVELDRRLQAQRRRAVLAEDYIVTLERTRLRSLGIPELAQAVRRVSDEDVTAGFDVLSFDGSGKRRFIEVKSSMGSRNWFVWSRNEYRCAHDRRHAYWIAWVGRAARLPDGPCEVAWFQDPAALLEESDSPWVIADGDLTVRRTADDTSFRSEV